MIPAGFVLGLSTPPDGRPRPPHQLSRASRSPLHPSRPQADYRRPFPDPLSAWRKTRKTLGVTALRRPRRVNRREQAFQRLGLVPEAPNKAQENNVLRITFNEGMFYKINN